MTDINNAPKVASVGSPSSNYEVTLDLNELGREQPLVGAMLALQNKMGDSIELAIGTVTEVTTRNRWHEDPNMRGTLVDGNIEGISGDSGDTRMATIRLQAAWRKENNGNEWKPSGPSLRMSPATGNPVHLVDDGVIHELTEHTQDLHYMGHLGGTENVRLPLSMPDFTTASSAYHIGCYGQSGAGKTQQVAYILAGQMRHENQGFIVVDPQGQWAAEEGMAFSVQGFASELGRQVKVRRISEHLRLTKDANLFCSLLSKTRFIQEITKMSSETQELVFDEIVKIVRDIDGWEDETSQELLKTVLLTLVNPHAKYISRIYADETRQERLREAITDILEDAKRLKEVMRLFSPIHNLFQSTNPVGGTRHSLWAEISAVFDRPANTPAPFLILDMSSKAAPGMDDETAMAAADAYEVLENDAVKAAILRNIFTTLKRASEDQFRNGKNLNTMVVLDEAWRYAPNPNGTEDKEIAELSRELAGYARDTRKFGIGWLYISQSTRSVNLNIWDQMSVRVFGFGLSGQDLDKMSEIVDDRNSLRLYRTFGNPRSTGRYPFLLTGPVSPLSANATPVVLQVYTDFQEFREDNNHWIEPARAKQGLPIVSGNPVAPKHSAAKPLPRIDRKAAANPVKAIVETNQAVKSNLASSGIKNVDGYGDPLNSMGEEEDLPF